MGSVAVNVQVKFPKESELHGGFDPLVVAINVKFELVAGVAPFTERSDTYIVFVPYPT
jgi:hypothetical protein